jgi:outer membrane protein assembly factor BamD
MRSKFLAILLFGLALLSLGSCNAERSTARKNAKSKAISDRLQAANWYFNHKKYDQAVYLYEELMPLYRGMPESQDMYFNYAVCRFKLGELVSAAFYYEDFVRQYPGSPRAEDAQFQSAYSYYLLADPYYLDQTFTYKALEKLQLFMSRYPYSANREKCEGYITTLRETLAQKSFEQSMLYYKISYYKAAVQSFQNTIREYPDSKFREESQFLLFKACYKMAEQSVTARKLTRYEQALDFYARFVEKFPSSKFAKEGENLKSAAEKEIVRLKGISAQQSEETLYRTFETHIRRALRSDDPTARKADYEDAMEAYDQLVKQNPQSPWVKEAEKYFKQWDREGDAAE